MPMAQVSAEHYIGDGVGDAPKVCINLISEENENDPNRRMRHIMRPGSVDRDTGNVLTSIPRGIAQIDGHADGKILVVDGNTVRTVTASASWGALTGTINGSDRVRMAFSEVEGAILSGGQIYVSTGTAVAQATSANYALHLSNHGQTEFTDIFSIGQRLGFLYGSRFGWSETLGFNNTETTYFLTTEDSPDGNVGSAVLNSKVFIFGTETIQIFVQTGQEGASAFRPQVGSTINRGCLTKHSIVQLDNTLFWVGDDYNIYRLNGLTPQLLSKPWISRALRGVDPNEIVASKMEIDGHSLYKLSTPVGEFVFDNLTQKWSLWESYDETTYEWGQVVEASGSHFAISRLNNRFAELSRAFESDYMPNAATFGTEIVWEFSAHLSLLGGRPPIPSVRVDGTRGRGSGADVNQDAYISLAVSRDGGITRSAYDPRSTGKQGEYQKRAIWWRLGDAIEPQVILFLRSNDPAMITGVVIGED